MRLAFHALSVFFASAAVSAPLELQLLGADGKGVGATVVVLRSTDPARALARPVQATMNQVSRQFDPHVLVIPTGSTVNFPNKDTVKHQVYSYSPAKTFELPLYRGNLKKPENFDTAGVVTVGCNIHDNMLAYIFVVDAQYFGRTDAGGIWKAPEVTPGNYTVQIWHPRARNMKPVIEQRVTVTAAEPRITLNLAAPLKLRALTEIPGNWDAY